MKIIRWLDKSLPISVILPNFTRYKQTLKNKKQKQKQKQENFHSRGWVTLTNQSSKFPFTLHLSKFCVCKFFQNWSFAKVHVREIFQNKVYL